MYTTVKTDIVAIRSRSASAAKNAGNRQRPAQTSGAATIPRQCGGRPANTRIAVQLKASASTSSEFPSTMGTQSMPMLRSAPSTVATTPRANDRQR